MDPTFGHIPQGICPITQTPIIYLANLGCGHHFNIEAIADWKRRMQENYRTPTCPVCRANFTVVTCPSRTQRYTAAFFNALSWMKYYPTYIAMVVAHMTALVFFEIAALAATPVIFELAVVGINLCSRGTPIDFLSEDLIFSCLTLGYRILTLQQEVWVGRCLWSILLAIAAVGMQQRNFALLVGQEWIDARRPTVTPLDILRA